MNFHNWLHSINILSFATLSLIYGVELRQPYNNLDILLREAQSTQTRLIEFLISIEHKSIIIDPGIKGLKTIQQLLATRWHGDASRITDYARATIGVENIKDLYDCLNAFCNSTLTIIDIKDNFLHPTPENYRDINIIFKDKINGMFGEVQINTLPLLEYKNSEGHDLFDEIRTIHAAVKTELRDITQEEQTKIIALTELSKTGYDAALQASLIAQNVPIRLGIYGIIVRNGKVLMTRTQSGSKQILNFPGGGIEMHEGFADALKRECFEELGMHIEIDQFLHASKELYVHENFPQSRMFNLYYLVKPMSQIGTGELDAEWHSINNLPLQNMLPIDQEFASILKNLVQQK